MLKRPLYPAAVMLLMTAGLFMASSLQLTIGDLSRPGPGFVPLVSGIALAVVMVAIWLNGDARPAPTDFLSSGLVAAAFLAFAFLISLGQLLPATAAGLLLVCCRSKRLDWRARLLFTLVATAILAVFMSILTSQ